MMSSARAPTELSVEMIHAARKGELKRIVKWLRTAGIDLQEAEHGNTLLHAATINQQFEVVRELMKRGASVNLPNYEASTVLMAAAEIGSVSEARLFLGHSADVNAATGHGHTALMTAVAHKQHDMASLLLQHSASVNVQASDGHSALMIASHAGADDCVRALLRAGANVDLRCGEGKTALRLAEEQGHVSTQVLLQSAINATCLPCTPRLAPSEVLLNVGGTQRVKVPATMVTVNTPSKQRERGRCDSGSRRALLVKALIADA